MEYAIDNYDDGLLFFYFSSSDLQSHMFWWNSDEQHPVRSAAEAQQYFNHIHRLYQRLDTVVGDIFDRYGAQATVIVMSDHGFANFGRQFNLNSWLRDFGYLNPRECTSVLQNVGLVGNRRLWTGDQRTVPESQRSRTGWRGGTG